MKKLNIAAKNSNWNEVYDFLHKNILEFNLKLEMVDKICIACEEIFVNISRYAYKKLNIDSGRVEISIQEDNNRLLILIIDEGIKFDPTESDLDIYKESQKSVEERKIGGFGIYIAKKYLDEIKYVRENNKNYLYMYKKLEK